MAIHNFGPDLLNETLIADSLMILCIGGGGQVSGLSAKTFHANQHKYNKHKPISAG